MDVGLVCDRCDAFNAMAAATCVSCGTGLSLGGRRNAPPNLAQPNGVAAIPEKTQARGSPVSNAVCKECGSPIQPGFRFCGSCGTPVQQGRHGEVRRTQYFSAMQQQARAKLVLIKGDGLDGVSFTLAGQEHVAGRTEGPLLFQDDP